MNIGAKVSIAITHKKGFVLSEKCHSDPPYEGHTLKIDYFNVIRIMAHP